MTPALSKLVKLLAELAIKQFLAEREREEAQEHEPDDKRGEATG